MAQCGNVAMLHRRKLWWKGLKVGGKVKFGSIIYMSYLCTVIVVNQSNIILKIVSSRTHKKNRFMKKFTFHSLNLVFSINVLTCIYCLCTVPLNGTKIAMLIYLIVVSIIAIGINFRNNRPRQKWVSHTQFHPITGKRIPTLKIKK
jgi:hypothetical protein